MGFNPCFDGSVARGEIRNVLEVALEKRFNPCFDGSVARGGVTMPVQEEIKMFQSLF